MVAGTEQRTERGEQVMAEQVKVHQIERLRWALALMEVGMTLRERLNAITEEADLTFNQWVVLGRVIEANGRATVSELAGEGGRAVHTLTSAINGLEHRGFVTRMSIKGEDRRIIRISATALGIASYSEVQWPAIDTLGKDLLTDDEIRALQAGSRPWKTPSAGRLMGLPEDPADATRVPAYGYRR